MDLRNGILLLRLQTFHWGKICIISGMLLHCIIMINPLQATEIIQKESLFCEHFSNILPSNQMRKENFALYGARTGDKDLLWGNGRTIKMEISCSKLWKIRCFFIFCSLSFVEFVSESCDSRRRRNSKCLLRFFFLLFLHIAEIHTILCERIRILLVFHLRCSFNRLNVYQKIVLSIIANISIH